MTSEYLRVRLRELASEVLPLPGCGATALRHRRLFDIGREGLSLAKLAEAHWDAVAILAEAGKRPEPDAIYAVWASEIPSQAMVLDSSSGTILLRGKKPFCSGLGFVDRALVTVTAPENVLIDVDLREQHDKIELDTTAWATEAFRVTNTGALILDGYRVTEDDKIGARDFYLSRPGFWQGACGPAACWAGGAAGLVEYAIRSKRDDPHTFAHVGAMDATLWTLQVALKEAGEEVDREPQNSQRAQVIALRLRHVVEQGCTEILRRFSRAFGPNPLAMDAKMALRYSELDLFLRQCHAERDLERLARIVRGV